jgi:ribosome-associated protein
MAPPEKGPQMPAAPRLVPVRLPITLGQFLKVAGLASSGGEAKAAIAAGSARVNGEIDIRRGHKLAPGDVVEVEAGSARVAAIDGATAIAEGTVGAGPDAPAGAAPNAAP